MDRDNLRFGVGATIGLAHTAYCQKHAAPTAPLR